MKKVLSVAIATCMLVACANKNATTPSAKVTGIVGKQVIVEWENGVLDTLQTNPTTIHVASHYLKQNRNPIVWISEDSVAFGLKDVK